MGFAAFKTFPERSKVPTCCQFTNIDSKRNKHTNNYEYIEEYL